VVDVARSPQHHRAQVAFLYCSGCGKMIDDLIMPEET
jgi:hypothetical protein